MQLYIVGGAVRDRLLGEPSADRDWVAVGATPEQLLALGYKPVGREFPVFLHPETGEEVALARTERKSGRGYHGFVFHTAPEVTLEQDLARRDLTVNAIAEDAGGRLIDPLGGQRDLAAGVLRHVSPAFEEDPVRILRVARFAARWPHFTVAGETMALMQRMVATGEADALVAERVWQEVARGLMSTRPSRLFEVLRECGALARLLPEPALDAPALAALDRAAAREHALPVRYALLGWPDAAAATNASARLRTPHDCAELAELLARERTSIVLLVGLVGLVGLAAPDPQPEALLALLERCDALRRPERFTLLLQAYRCTVDEPQGQRAEALRTALAAAQSIDTAAVASAASAAGARGPAIGAAVRAARLEAVGHRVAEG